MSGDTLNLTLRIWRQAGPEARGQFRADGLATGLCLGMGLPSKHPAEPEDRPRSLYALNRARVDPWMTIADGFVALWFEA